MRYVNEAPQTGVFKNNWVTLYGVIIQSVSQLLVRYFLKINLRLKYSLMIAEH